MQYANENECESFAILLPFSQRYNTESIVWESVILNCIRPDIVQW
jgi:hypothetical protein